MPEKLQNLSVKQLTIAINNGFKRMGEVAPQDVVYTVKTANALTINRQPWIDVTDLETSKAGDKTTDTNKHQKELLKLERLNSGFIQGLDSVITIGIVENTVRPWFGLKADRGGVPNMDKQDDVTYWADKIIKGEATRVNAGGTAFGYPFSATAIAAQLAVVELAKTASANAEEAHNNAQEQIETMRKNIIEPLQVQMWAESETAYVTDTKTSQREKARRWGVKYIPSPGETGVIAELLGVDNTHIAGEFNVSDGYHGVIDNSGLLHLTIDDGLIIGDYMVTLSSPGYIPQTVPLKIEKGKTTVLKITLVKFPMPPV